MFPVLSFTPRDHFYKADLYILIPFAFAARSPPQHLATISLFFVSVSSILFCLFFYFVF